MYGNRPRVTRKTVRFMIGLTILAWATQTLLHQWGYGAEVTAPPAEKFVPADRGSCAGTLEIRPDATIFGDEIHLKQVARWSAADRPAFEPLAELVLTRVQPGSAFGAVTLDQVRTTLRDAGVNLGRINFAGPTACTVTRADADLQPGKAMEEWAAAKEPARAEPTMANRPAVADAASRPASTQPAGEDKLVRTLRDVLVEDLAQRLSIPVQSLQVQFSPKDERVLRLVEPQFRFAIEGRRVRDLGDVAWDVTILATGGSQRASVSAYARAWQDQLVTARPMSARAVFRSEDVIARRILVDRLQDESLLSAEQVVGQQAARDINAGTVVVGRLVEAMPMVQPGQLVTIVAEQGRIQIKTVAEAKDGGSFGQVIRVRNPVTREEFAVQITGPQAGKVVGSPAGVGTKMMAARE